MMQDMTNMMVGMGWGIRLIGLLILIYRNCSADKVSR
jgi:hypothetical protein